MKPKLLPILAIYALGFGFGLTITVLAPAMDAITSDFGITMAEGGLTNTLLNVGGTAGVLFSLFFSDRFSKKLSYGCSYALLALSLLLCFTAGSYPLFLFYLLLMGIGGKIVDTLGNPLVRSCAPGQTSRYLNLLHTVIGVGACASPVLMQLLLDAGLSWKLALTLIGVLCLAFFVVCMPQIPRGTQDEDASAESGSQDSKLTLWAILLVCLCVFFYVGHQVIVNTWAPMYMQTTLGLDGIFASLSTAALWAGIIAGRLICARFARTEHAIPLGIWGDLIGGIVLTLAIISCNGIIVLIGILITGVATGAVLPMCIDLLTSRRPSQAGRLSSCIFLSIVVSSMIFPVIAGALADTFGFTSAMLLSALALLPAALAALLARPLFK